MTTAAAHQIPAPFAPVPHNLTRDLTLSFPARSLYQVLSTFTTVKDRTCFPGRRLLCNMTGWSPRTLEKYTDELVASGWVNRQQRRDQEGRFRGHLYTVYFSRDREGGSQNPITEPIEHRESLFTARQILQQEEEPKTSKEENNTHDQVQAPQEEPVVCAHGDEKPIEAPEPTRPTVYLVKRSSSTRESDPAILESINAQLREGVASGTIRNPIAYKRTLLSLAQRGEYIVPNQSPAAPALSVSFDETREYIQRIDQARDQAKEDKPQIKAMLRSFLQKTSPHISFPPQEGPF